MNIDKSKLNYIENFLLHIEESETFLFKEKEDYVILYVMPFETFTFIKNLKEIIKLMLRIEKKLNAFFIINQGSFYLGIEDQKDKATVKSELLSLLSQISIRNT